MSFGEGNQPIRAQQGFLYSVSIKSEDFKQTLPDQQYMF